MSDISTELSVNWWSSPRIITVKSPRTEVTIQDLVDSLRVLEADNNTMDDPYIISAGGKESLGGGVYVGITATLRNALISFETRTGPTYTQCKVTGGNLVAVQADLETYFNTPVDPTAFTQIVITASSSATALEQKSIIYGSFQDNAVWVKEGSGNHEGDSDYVGNREFPVETVAEAISIADGLGLAKIGLLSDYVLGAGEDINDFIIFGENPLKTSLFIGSDAIVENCEIRECFVGGVIDGETILRNCIVSSLDWISGYLYNCIIYGGTINVINGGTAYIYHCSAGAYETGDITFDLGGTGQNIIIQSYTGRIKIRNKNGTETIVCNIGDGGHLTLDDTVTAGTIIIRGNALLSDTSDEFIPSGIWNGVTIVNDTSEPKNIAYIALNEKLIYHQIENTAGLALIRQCYTNRVVIDESSIVSGDSYPYGTCDNPVNNWPDALAVSNLYSIPVIHVHGDTTVPSGTNLKDKYIESHATLDRTIALENGCQTQGSIFTGFVIEGYFSGRVRLIECDLQDIFNFKGTIENSFISGDVIFEVSAFKSYITNCMSGTGPTRWPSLNIDGAIVSIRAYYGNLEIAGKTGAHIVGVGFTNGLIRIANTCTEGILKLIGNARVVEDVSGAGCTVDTSDLLSLTNIAETVWVDTHATNLISDVGFIKNIEGGRWKIDTTTNQMIFFEDDNITEVTRFNLLDASGNPVSSNVFERVKV